MDLGAELSAAVWWSTVLLLKLATFPPIIGATRVLQRKVFVTAEDVSFFGGQEKIGDAVVERRRR